MFLKIIIVFLNNELIRVIIKVSSFKLLNFNVIIFVYMRIEISVIIYYLFLKKLDVLG